MRVFYCNKCAVELELTRELEAVPHLQGVPYIPAKHKCEHCGAVKYGDWYEDYGDKNANPSTKSERKEGIKMDYWSYQKLYERLKRVLASAKQDKQGRVYFAAIRDALQKEIESVACDERKFEVIFCKDCVNFVKDGTWRNHNICQRGKLMKVVAEDDYCSHAEVEHHEV